MYLQNAFFSGVNTNERFWSRPESSGYKWKNCLFPLSSYVCLLITTHSRQPKNTHATNHFVKIFYCPLLIRHTTFFLCAHPRLTSCGFSVFFIMIKQHKTSTLHVGPQKHNLGHIQDNSARCTRQTNPVSHTAAADRSEGSL